MAALTSSSNDADSDTIHLSDREGQVRKAEGGRVYVEEEVFESVELAKKVEEDDWEDVDAEEAKEGDYVFI